MTGHEILTRVRWLLAQRRDAKSAWLSAFALGLDLARDDSVQTAATDGVTLFYNENYITSSELAHVGTTVCHEALHIGLGHHLRRGSRDPRLWNIACDMALYHILVEMGLRLRENAVSPASRNLPSGQTAEWYYAQLTRDQGDQGDQGDYGDGDVLDAPPSATSETTWRVQVARAASAARGVGTLPDALARAVDAATVTRLPWYEILRDFLQRRVPSESSFRVMPRRWRDDIILPGVDGNVANLMICIDTSGSCWDFFPQFCAGIEHVIESFDSVAIDAVYADEAVMLRRKWESGNRWEDLRQFPSGGGTSHRWLTNEIESLEEAPDVVLCFTDLATDFPDVPPETPVVWVVCGNYGEIPPWGEVIRLVRDFGA